MQKKGQNVLVRKYIFEKKNKQTILYDEQARTKKPNDKKAQGRTNFGMNTVR